MSNVLHSLWSRNVNMFHWRKHHLQLNYITWGRKAGGIQRSQNTFRALCGGPFFLELQCLRETCREFEGKKCKIGKGTLKRRRMRPFEATACWRCQAASAGRRPGRAHHGSLAPLWVFEPSGTFQSWSMLCYMFFHVFSIFFLSYYLLPFKSFPPIFSIYFRISYLIINFPCPFEVCFPPPGIVPVEILCEACWTFQRREILGSSVAGGNDALDDLTRSIPAFAWKPWGQAIVGP